MPTNKDFKRVVRDRMKKTGESYSTARAHLLRKKTPSSSASSPTRASAPAPSPSQYAKLAGMSDASVKKATGSTWDQWVKALDRVNADGWPHKQIAEYVHTKHKVPDWWTQTVTVGYERIKGLRARGQQRDGTYEVSKSKVIAAPLDQLFDAFNNPKMRSRWLSDVPFEVRHTTKHKSIRMRSPDGSVVDVGFLGKGAAKSQVAIGHRKLPSQSDAARAKTFWAERLQALASLVGGRNSAR